MGIPAGAHYYDDGRGWFGGSDINNAYEASAIAYSCISQRARDVANVPLIFLSDKEDPESEVKDGDPIKNLFSNPNSTMSRSQFIEYCATVRLLRGECFTVFDNPRNPQVMWPGLDPLDFKEVKSGFDLTGWRFRHNKDEQTFLAGEVLHEKLTNPYNPFRGQSPLKAACYALGIDIRGDSLNLSKLSRGGENAMLYEQTEAGFDPDQSEQLLNQLRARRQAGGTVARDAIIPYGLNPVDPKFTASDLDILGSQLRSTESICFVYGMNPFLIGKGDAAKYDSSSGIIRLYWERTLVPDLNAMESAWDDFFMERHGFKTYVRFDKSKVKALQDDEFQKARVASVYLSKGIPVAEVNRRFNLGFEDNNIPGAEEVLVPMSLVPVSAILAGGAGQEDQNEAPPPDKDGDFAGLRQKINERIKKKNAHMRLSRLRRLMNIERSAKSRLRNVFGDYKKKTLALIDDVFTRGPDLSAMPAVTDKLNKMKEQLGEDIYNALSPGYAASVQEGVASIQALVKDGANYQDIMKAATFTPDVERILAERKDWALAVKSGELIDDVTIGIENLVREAVKDNRSASFISAGIRNLYNGQINNATTIARTEMGFVFNASRFNEMGQQGFEKHEWLTAADEVVREEHMGQGTVNIGDPFPNGMNYPQEDGHPPEMVINCRCETIPVV
jgi:HK97 family phage portal protein